MIWSAPRYIQYQSRLMSVPWYLNIYNKKNKKKNTNNVSCNVLYK